MSLYDHGGAGVGRAMKGFPRVLVLSPVNFNQQSGSGVTMGNLFRGWPLDSIAQVYSTGEMPDEEVCRRYFHLPWRPSGRIGGSEANEVLSLATGRLERLVPLKELLDWCRAFSPDVIYARPSEAPRFYTWLPRILAENLGVPYVVRVLDDWPARYERRKGLREWAVWKPLMRRNLERLFEEAALNLCISPEMSDAYEARYGCAFSHVSNCIDVQEWPLLKEEYGVSGEFTILYMGEASEDKEYYSLKDIRDAVVSLRSRDYAMGMVIYGPPRWEKKVREHLADCDGITYGGYFDVAEKNRILSRADLLALPINFDENSAAYIRYSFQTKVPEYMASGTPVLVYAPEFSPNVRYAQEGQWGYVVKERDREILERALVELQGSERLRERLGRRARQIALKNHDARTVRREFREMIAGAAGMGRNEG